MLEIGTDAEWDERGLSVLGIAWDGGRKASATPCTPKALGELVALFHRADSIAMHNGLGADLRRYQQAGVNISAFQHKLFDTFLAMHAIAAHLAGTGSYDLRSCALLLGRRGHERFPLDFKKYAEDIYATCAHDAAASLWIAHEQKRRISAWKLDKTIAISHAVAPMFAQMHERGVKLDVRVLEQIHRERKAKTERIIAEYGLVEQRGKKVVRDVPIWRSPKVLDLFEERFGIRPKSRAKATWDALAKDTSLPQQARDFAEALIDLSKGANDAHWLGEVTEADDGSVEFGKVDSDGYIHPEYNIAGSPDRPIAKNPNIQNWPRPKDDPRIVPIRSAVIPLEPDHVLLNIDYSSVETYTNAIELGDWDMIQDVVEGRLSHESTADMLNRKFRLNLDRQGGKTVRHAADKGESPFALAVRLFNVARPSRQQVSQCKEIFETLLSQYPETAKARDALWERAQQNPLVVTNAFGRRLLCFSRSKYGDASERFAKHDPARKYWCPCAACAPRRDRWKYALAFLGRSSAIDVLLRAMHRIYSQKLLDSYSLPLMEVHDSLVWSVPLDKAIQYAKIASACMSEPVDELGGIALPCKSKLGNNLAEAS